MGSGGSNDKRTSGRSPNEKRASGRSPNEKRASGRDALTDGDPHDDGDRKFDGFRLLGRQIRGRVR